MVSRRHFLKGSTALGTVSLGTAAGAGLLGGALPALAADATRAAALNPRRLEAFRDPLPRPARLPGQAGGEISIAMTEFTQVLHSQMKPTLLWGYAGSYPGPTIEARRGVPLRVTFRNELRDVRLLAALPVDQTLHWADPLGAAAGLHAHGMADHKGGHAAARAGSTQGSTKGSTRGSTTGANARALRRRYAGPVPLVTHLHGAEAHSASDGHPEAWYTPGLDRRGPAFVREHNDFPNAQPAGTLWYHDHALGITRLTTYAGLAGFYLLRDPELERALGLPSGEYEREIVIQDRAFDVNGQLRYAQRGVDPAAHPFWVPEFFGDTILANGRVWPYMEVEPRRYRLRLLNGSGARFYQLSLSDGRPFFQVASDGHFLPQAVELRRLLLAPGERADVVVDFSGLAAGTTIVVGNDAPTPFPKGDAPDPRTTGRVMQFRVVPPTGVDASSVPGKLVDLPDLGAPVLTRTLTLDEHAGHKGPHMALLDGKRWMDPVSEAPRLGSTEVWEFANLTEDAHPMHLHLVGFQVLDRQPFRAGDYAKRQPGARGPLADYLSGPARPPEPHERGLKDTVVARPGEVTRIKVRFAPSAGGAFPFDATSGPGYVWHCHILEHEDNEMMRPYVVKPA